MFRDNEIIAKIDLLTEEVGKLLDYVREEEEKRREKEVAERVKARSRRNEDDLGKEEWRRVLFKGQKAFLEVSNYGRVRDSVTKREITQTMSPNNKPRVNIVIEGKVTTALVQNIVARAFIDDTLPYRTKAVRHIDGDAFNNRVDNLYIVRRTKTPEK